MISFHQGKRWVASKFQYFRLNLDFRGQPVVVEFWTCHHWILWPRKHKYRWYRKIIISAWHDGREVSASGWGSGGPRFQSRPRLTFQSCSRHQLNQLESKAASESTFKQSNTCGVSNTRLYFTLLFHQGKRWVTSKFLYFRVKPGFSRSTGSGRILNVSPLNSSNLENINIVDILKFHQGKRWVTSKFQYFRFKLDFRGQPVVVEFWTCHYWISRPWKHKYWWYPKIPPEKKMGNLEVPVFPVQTGFSRSTGDGRILNVSL